MNLQVAFDVFEPCADGRRIQSNIDQRADVLGVVVFAEVESETVIGSRLRRALEESNQDRSRNKSFWIGQGRSF